MMRRVFLWLILIFFIGVICLNWFIQSSYVQKRIYPLKYKNEVIKFSKEYKLDPHLVMGIIWVESKFKPDATSNRDARGLMQIIPRTGEWIADQVGLSPYDDGMLYDPEINIRFGCWYFAYLLKVFNEDIELALASYNGGMGNVMKWLNDNRYSEDGKHLKNIPFKETSDYLKRVMEAQEKYKELYEF
ncbi:MAG: lytic transglycosylase domain-containing protein [Clostridiales bacterium]|nr:lytic transglycosylase domain-containing protein [Clostridiales bacterium]